jgi:hypothetical protein
MSRTVVGSIPDGVTGSFHCRNPSGLTMVLGSTLPLTNNISCGVKAASACPKTLPPSCAIFLDDWETPIPGILRACPVLYRNCFIFHLCLIVLALLFLPRFATKSWYATCISQIHAAHHLRFYYNQSVWRRAQVVIPQLLPPHTPPIFDKHILIFILSFHTLTSKLA